MVFLTIEEMLQIKEERGYSLQLLSQYSGVPVVTLQKIFSGKTAHPRKATLLAIEQVLSSREEQLRGKAYVYSQQRAARQEILHDPSSTYGKTRQRASTLADYYALPDDRRCELIDGVLYDINAPTLLHQDIIFTVHRQFHDYIQQKKKPCRVFSSPVDVQLDCDDQSMLQPDLVVLCRKEQLRAAGIYGAPDYVLEVLSPSTRKRDLILKLAKYQTAGVREYWIIDPENQLLITYNFMDENYIPVLHPLAGSVPVAISGRELQIDLQPVAQAITELGL